MDEWLRDIPALFGRGGSGTRAALGSALKNNGCNCGLEVGGSSTDGRSEECWSRDGREDTRSNEGRWEEVSNEGREEPAKEGLDVFRSMARSIEGRAGRGR